MSPSLLLPGFVVLALVLGKSNQHAPISVETCAKRNYFYVGGHYQNVTVPNIGTSQVFLDQMYVEQLTPQVIKQEHPLVFLSGSGQTGTNWLNTPDGRQGWASYFLDRGFVIYLTDQPQRGRSAWLPGDGSLGLRSVQEVQKYFITVQNFKLWPQAALHTQWPGTGLVGDPTFDALYKSQVQYQANSTMSEASNCAAGVALLDRIGPAIIVTHSQAGPYGWGIGDARPALVKGIVAIEPQGPPFVDQIIGTGFTRPYGITSLPVAYDPPVTDPATDLLQEIIPPTGKDLSSCILQKNPPKRLINLSKVPVQLITSEASYHAVYDYCTVDYLQQAGVNVQWLNLPDVGIHGNGHFLFMEKNRLGIAALVEQWIFKSCLNRKTYPVG